MINHSGGCSGADIEWETQGNLYNIHTISYSFYNHIQYGKNPKILTQDELKEGFEHILIANKILKRHPESQSNYIKNLLSRNWFQVKNAESIYAIGTFLNSKHKLVNGGTGWAVQMALDNKKEAFFFDQESSKWYEYGFDKFEEKSCTPILTEHFAGIGTRQLKQNGKDAIKEVLDYTFNKL